ncbi:hypothetical protein ACFX13_006340 [Malus domestica]
MRAEEARRAREAAFDARLIGPGGVMAEEARHIILKELPELEDRQYEANKPKETGIGIDLNVELQNADTTEGHAVNGRGRQNQQGIEIEEIMDKGTMEDDPFELNPIIEAVMRETKGKKRQFPDAEQKDTGELWEPKGRKQRLIVLSEAEETSLDNLMEQNKLHTPDIVILLETKNRSSRYVFLKKRLGMDFMHAVEPRGIVGGMCIFWRNYDLVMLVKYSAFFIEVGISDKLKDEEWRLFAVYASTDDKKRRDQWRILSQRLGVAEVKCIVIGDFNDILDDSEKE